MRKSLRYIVLTLAIILVLGACGNNNAANNNSTQNAENDSTNNNATVNEDDNASENNTAENEDDLSAILKTIEEADDQLNLKLGETGSYVTTLGTYDMTVTSAELKGYEFEGYESELDCWVVLDITIKNTSDETLQAEDLMEAMELTEVEEGSGYIDSAGAFESVEEFEGEIAPNEEKSAQFVAYAYESDTYFFRKTTGNIAGGSSNQVMWKIEKDDMKQ